jgi:apolipoprotein N-acyltransferase
VALALAAMRRPRLEFAWLVALPFLILLPKPDPPPRAREAAVLVQPNISTTEDWTAASVERIERDLARLSVETVKTAASGPPPSLIVWPEMPAPFYYDADARFRELVDSLARATNVNVLLGVVGHRADGAPVNSAALVSRAGTLVSRYDKMNLVPFGEFVPWPFGGITQKISTEAGDFAPGTRLVVSPMDGHRIGAFICYESVFPNFVRQFAANGAEVLFNLSNDGFFGRSAARLQHLDIVRMRAAENRRWILRATNDGITATIDPAGRLRGTLPPYIEAASRTGFTYIAEQTVYTRYGDWFPVSCGVGAACLLGLAFARPLKRTEP